MDQDPALPLLGQGQPARRYLCKQLLHTKLRYAQTRGKALTTCAAEPYPIRTRAVQLASRKEVLRGKFLQGTPYSRGQARAESGARHLHSVD